MYIFSAPIQYKNKDKYETIDNSIIISNNKKYAYQNKGNSIITYFPKSLKDSFRIEYHDKFLEISLQNFSQECSPAKIISYKNMYGDSIKAVIYEGKDANFVFYPTNFGIKSEIVFKNTPDSEITYRLHTSANYYLNQEKRYILLQSESDIESVIQQPIIQSDEEKRRLATMEMKEYENDYNLRVILNNESLSQQNSPAILETTFDMYQNKIPDTSVYSNYNNNSYLRSYAIIGKHPEFGEGWEYIRFKLSKLFYTREENILDAKYYIKGLTGCRDNNVQVYQPEDRWPSSQMVWNSKIASDKGPIAVSKKENGYYIFDLTNFAKQCFSENSQYTESKGIILKCDADAYHVLATADHSLYPPFIKIDLRTEPKGFVELQDINDPT